MTNRRPIVAGNWKMNTTVAEAVALATSLRTVLHDVGPTEVVLCPPTVSLVSVHGVIHGTHLGLGAQNVHFETHGAHTGEVCECRCVIRDCRALRTPRTIRGYR